MAEKTEAPTPRRLRRAREQGDVPVSAALLQAAAFLVCIELLAATARETVTVFAGFVQRAFAGQTIGAAELAVTVLGLCAPTLGAAAVVALMFGYAQTGGLFGLTRLAPDLNRLNPLNGLKSLFSGQRLFGLARALLGAGLVAWLGWSSLRAALPALAGPAGEPMSALATALSAGLGLARWVAFIGVGLALVDWWLVRRSWLSRWRMTRDEARRELREHEGDPELKAARQRAHQQLLARAAIHAVKDAALVVDAPQFAVALRYRDNEDDAPHLLAKGDGDLARSISEAAHSYGIPAIRDASVARALREVEVGAAIPEALYATVAELLRAARAKE